MSEGEDRAETGGKSPQTPIQGVFHRFTGTQRALLELADAVRPHLDQFGKETRSLTLPPMTEEEGRRFKEVLEANAESNSEEDRSSEENNDADSKGVEIGKVLGDIYSDRPEVLRHMASAIIAVTEAPKHDHLLYSALLTAAVGALEAAVSGVVGLRYSAHPDALPASDISFTFADLKAMESIQDARDIAITKRVDEIMWPGIDSWAKWIDHELKHSSHELADDWNKLYEVIQRRHLLVHAGGIASRQYCAKVPDTDVSVGDELRLDRVYLEAAIEQLTIFGVRLILWSWAKWEVGGHDQVVEEANNYVVNALAKRQDRVAMCISETADGFDGPEKIKLYLKVNRWQAIKRIHGLSAIEEEVSGWDTSAFKGEFDLARYCLCEDWDKVFNLIPSLYDQGLISEDELNTWPLFSEARTRPEWEETMATIFPDTPEAEDSQVEL